MFRNDKTLATEVQADSGKPAARGAGRGWRLAVLTVTAVATLATTGCAVSRRDAAMVGGAVVGGVAGSAVTGGSTVGTVGGAVLGGMAGREIEKRTR